MFKRGGPGGEDVLARGCPGVDKTLAWLPRRGRCGALDHLGAPIDTALVGVGDGGATVVCGAAVALGGGLGVAVPVGFRLGTWHIRARARLGLGGELGGAVGSGRLEGAALVVPLRVAVVVEVLFHAICAFGPLVTFLGGSRC